MIGRVLVTGGNGFLGGRVLARLGLEGRTYWAPESSQCDLMDPISVRRAFDSFRPDIVIHLAGVVGGITSNMEQPAQLYYKNLQMGVNIIENACQYGAMKLVIAGTACSYPLNAPLPLNEKDIYDGIPESSNAPYGMAKRALLTMASAYREQYGIRLAYLLLANLYGPGQDSSDGGHFIPAFANRLLEAKEKEREAVKVWGDGTPTRDFLHVDDAADAIIVAMKDYDSSEPVNVGTGEEHSIKEVAELLKDISLYQGKLIWDTDKPLGQPRRVLDTKKMREELNFMPKTSLIEGLREVVWSG